MRKQHLVFVIYPLSSLVLCDVARKVACVLAALINLGEFFVVVLAAAKSCSVKPPEKQIVILVNNFLTAFTNSLFIRIV